MSSSISLKKKVAWGITGSGDEIKEILDKMIDLRDKFRDVDIRVYVSKSGEQVLRMYSIFDDLQAAFPVVKVEIPSPLAGPWSSPPGTGCSPDPISKRS